MPTKQKFAFAPNIAQSPPIARVYIRVSSIYGRGEGTGRDLLSPETQMEAGRTLARTHGWILDEEASLQNTDLDESAFRQTWDKRKGLVAHLEDARRGQFQVLVAYKLGRLARNAREGLVLCDLFAQAGVGVYTQVEGIDPNTAIGRMQRTFMFGVAEMQSENISEDVTSNFATRVRNGKPHGRPPAWVRKDPQSGALSLDPAGAASLRRLVELRLIPTSYSLTARTLNAEGHRRPQEQHCERRGDKRPLWTASTVHKALNPRRRFLMRGHFEYLRELEEDDPRRVKLLDVWPSLLESEVADKLDATEARLHEQPLTSPLPPGGRFPSQRGADANCIAPKGETLNHRATVAGKYLLSGLLFCSGCGARLQSGTRSYKNGNANIRYYWCRNASAQPELHPPRNQGGLGASFDADMVEWAVLRIVEAAIRVMRESADSFRVQTPLPVKSANRSANRESGGLSAAAEKAKVAKGIAHLFELLEEDAITKADFKIRYRELETRRNAILTSEAEALGPTILAQAVEALSPLDAAAACIRGGGGDGKSAAPVVRALGTGRQAIRPAQASHEAIAAANLFLRNLIERIDVPVMYGDYSQREDLKNPSKTAYTYPLRFTRVHFRQGLLPARSAVSALRQMKWKRDTPEVVFEAD